MRRLLHGNISPEKFAEDVILKASIEYPAEKPSSLRGIIIASGIFIAAVAATIVLDMTGYDLSVPSMFYDPKGSNEGWVYAKKFPWGVLYKYGEIFPLFIFAAALIIYIGTKAGKVAGNPDKACLVMVLTLILGPGLMVNGILKNYWGRPRPADIAAFSGSGEYRKVWEPGTPGQGKSFPCGHCSMGYALSSSIAFYRFFPTASLFGLFFGICYGTVLGAARVVQGGHFPSDVVWSAAVVFSIIAVLYYYAGLSCSADEKQRIPLPK